MIISSFLFSSCKLRRNCRQQKELQAAKGAENTTGKYAQKGLEITSSKSAVTKIPQKATQADTTEKNDYMIPAQPQYAEKAVLISSERKARSKAKKWKVQPTMTLTLLRTSRRLLWSLGRRVAAK